MVCARSLCVRADWLAIAAVRKMERRLFDIRWDRADHFKVVLYQPGDWEGILLGWPEPIPFD